MRTALTRIPRPLRWLLALLPLQLVAGPSLAQESPWLLIPTLSSDPKLGTNAGAVAGYLLRLDPQSRKSLVGTAGSYSNTDSWYSALFGDLHYGANRHRLKVVLGGGRVRNEYEDYLGTGLRVKTEDDFKALFLRYSTRVASDWYLGAQAVSTNYAIGIDGIEDGILEQIGLTGINSNGIGGFIEFDSRDRIRNPRSGSRFALSNIAYREALGGDQSFDTLLGDYRHFSSLGGKHVLGVHLKGHWTRDAPLAGFSSVKLRGYTRGNYLAENYAHVDVDLRLRLRGRLGAGIFAGVGCLFAGSGDCSDSENLYPAAGAGLIYDLKPESGFVLRAEYAMGKADNAAFYLTLGHPF